MASFSFTDWVEFTFGIGRYPRPLAGAYPGSAQNALEHCVRFFENSSEVLSEIPPQNATVALEDMPSIDGYGGLLSWTDLSLADRFTLADSQYELFRNTFSKDPFGSAAFLWWERLIGAEWNDGPTVQQDKVICDRIVQVLTRILDLDAETCVKSALHGLNEFVPNSNNPDILRVLVERFVASRPTMSTELRSYALKVALGEAP